MPTIKTAISLEEDLLAQVRELANSLNISRSRVFALAAEEFVKRQRNEQITRQLNEAYADGPDDEEQEWLRRMRPTHRRLTKNE